MICPHCSGRIGFFSRAINGWGKKFCPHCEAPIAIGINWKLFAVLLVPFAIVFAAIATYVRIQFDLSSGKYLGPVLGAALIVVSMRLKPDERP